MSERDMRYFITFTCYGARIHGDESGSVDRAHNLFGSLPIQPDSERARTERHRMSQPSYEMDSESRALVLRSIVEVCSHRGWILLAAHVRTNHVHVVAEAEVLPEKVMNAFKAYASRALNRGSDGKTNRKRWAYHGSTRWLWTDQAVRDAICYVVEQQGEPMAVFVSDMAQGRQPAR